MSKRGHGEVCNLQTMSMKGKKKIYLFTFLIEDFGKADLLKASYLSN